MEWAQLLPEGFEFYHLGHVQAKPSPGYSEAQPQFADSLGVAFRVSDRATDDLIAWLVVVFDHGLDAATYSEMGNVIASRFAGRIAAEQHLAHGATISPPRELTSAQLVRMFSQSNEDGQEARLYHHVQRDRIVSFRAFVLPVSTEGFQAHA